MSSSRVGIEIPNWLLVEIALEASARGAVASYLPLGRELGLTTTGGTGASVSDDQYTRVTYTFYYRAAAEDFSQFLASKGLVFQVDFYYDLKTRVSFVVR